ncbi:MAG: hypothetical protein ACHQ16_00075 [Candidatus Lutacidiplasmatales archaeon]
MLVPRTTVGVRRRQFGFVAVLRTTPGAGWTGRSYRPGVARERGDPVGFN